MGLLEMKKTMIEKLIARKVRHEVVPGDIVTVSVDRVMLDDIMMPFIAAKFEEMGFQKVWDPEKVVIICDHLVPASQTDDIRAYKLSNDFAAKYGIPNLHRSDGICHQLMIEAGYVKPGDLVFGTDSHTTTYGCVDAFSTGIGYTEMAAVLGTGEIWLRIPETIRVEINGTLPANVMSKDVILRVIGDLTAAGATYRALEFTGDTVADMSLSSRMTMANMGIEAGAKCALFVPDEKTAAYLGIDLTEEMRSLAGDADASYVRCLQYRAEDFVPVMALPSNVDHVAPVSELEALPIDEVFLGSCTNGRLEDLMAAAGILRGRHVAPFVKLIVTPASRRIWEEAEENGTLATLSAAGAMITHPSCGLCCGRTGGILSDGERVVATNNRNFLGRMGSSKVEIYLASPKTAAACALAGKLTEAEC